MMFHAPWTDEQVKLLIARQNDGMKHPYTCTCKSANPLLVTNDGFICAYCGKKQDWCHAEDLIPPKRVQITHEQIDTGMEDLLHMINFRLAQKGRGSFSSKHEILGIITEEYLEFNDAVRKNGPKDELEKELIDIAVAAIFGYICSKNNTLDW